MGSFSKEVYFVSYSTGALASGWVKYNGKTYYFDPDKHTAAQGLKKIDGDLYYFLGTERNMRTGFMNFTSASKKRYFGPDGKMVRGWVTIGNDKYYADPSDGYLKMNGIFSIGNNKYYFDASGKLVTDKTKYSINGELFDIDSNGKLSYFVEHDEIAEISGTIYSDGAPAVGSDSGRNTGTYIKKDDGTIAAGPQIYKIGEDLYFAKDSNGILASGWFDYGGAKYYADPYTYTLARGLTKIGGDSYYFIMRTAKMITGFVSFGSIGTKRFFGADGKMVTGWQKINGNIYYFSAVHGLMASNEIINVKGSQYYVKDDGKLVTNQRNYMIEDNTYDIDLNGVLTLILQNDEYEVALCGNDGSIYQKTAVKKGKQYLLPGMPNPSGATFMGWAATPNVYVTPAGYNGKVYEIHESVIINSNTKFYAVLFRDTDDIDIDEANLPDLSDKYAALIVVGDSRQNYICSHISNYRRLHSNVIFIAKGGTRYDWMSGSAYPQLITTIKNIRKSSEKPIAVLFSHGINDLRGDDIVIDPYITFMNEKAPELLSCNCKLFYMSANPSNPAQMSGKFDRVTDMNAVRLFNLKIRNQLTGYTYIDMYSWMMKYGFKSYDGLHYSQATDRRCFNAYMHMINSGNF